MAAKPQPEKPHGIEPETLALALACLVEQFPNRQLNGAELSIATGIGRTAMTKISQSTDSPFTLGKSTGARLNAWLQKHTGFKAGSR
jgi:hypothetical protein